MTNVKVMLEIARATCDGGQYLQVLPEIVFVFFSFLLLPETDDITQI